LIIFVYHQTRRAPGQRRLQIKNFRRRSLGSITEYDPAVKFRMMMGLERVKGLRCPQRQRFQEFENVMEGVRRRGDEAQKIKAEENQ
jgi:hypothetical protein